MFRTPFQFNDGDPLGGGGTAPAGEPAPETIDPNVHQDLLRRYEETQTLLGQARSQNDQLQASHDKWLASARQAYATDPQFAQRLMTLMQHGTLPPAPNSPPAHLQDDDIDWTDARQRDEWVERKIEERISPKLAATEARQRSTDFEHQFLMLATTEGREAAVAALPAIKRWMIEHGVADFSTVPGGIHTAFKATRDLKAERERAIAEFRQSEAQRVASMRGAASLSSPGPHGTLQSYTDIREKQGTLAAIDKILADEVARARAS